MIKELKIKVSSDIRNEKRIEDAGKILFRRIEKLNVNVRFEKILSKEKGTKSIEAIDWTTIILSLTGPSVTIALIKILSDFLTKNRRIEITLKYGNKEVSIKGGTFAESEKILNKYFDKKEEDE